METVLNAFPGATSQRFVVTCVQRVGLESPDASLIPEPLSAHLLEGPLVEAWMAPSKTNADVVLARAPASESTRAWIEDAAGGEPRAIALPLLGPTSAQRWRHLVNHAAQRWASIGGLRSIGARKLDGRWQTQTCSIPEGVTPEYFNVAPLEQQLSRIAGSERLWLDAPSGRFSSRLPGVELAVWVTDVSPPELVTMRLDTVVVDPEVFDAALFWRGSFSRPLGAALPRIVADLLLPGANRPPPPSPSGTSSGALKPMPTAQIDIGAARFDEPTGQLVAVADAVLPFKQSGPPQRRESDASDLGGVTVPKPAMLSRLEAFGAADDPLLHETQNTSPELPAPTETALPFRTGAGPVAELSQAVFTPPPERPAVVPMPVMARPSFEIARSEAQLRGFDEAVMVNAMIADEPSELDAGPPTQPRHAAEPTLEEVATIDAELALEPAVATVTLDVRGLTLAGFASARSTWLEAIAADSKKGKRDLQRRYDAVYLERIEQLRGRPVSTEEYARLVVAIERLDAAQVLTELGLPSRCQLIVTRVFSDRSSRSVELRRAIIESVHRARG